MLNSEKKLLAMLLEESVYEFSNHGCNDMPRGLFAKFTPEEQAELLATYNEGIKSDNPTDEGTSELRFTLDWLWMNVLAEKLKKEVANGN